MRYLQVFILSLIPCIFVTGTGETQPFGLEERLGNMIPAGLYVEDADSEKLLLDSVIDKPTLIAFTYFRCNALCPKTFAGLAELITYATVVPGIDYQIIAFSINHSETSQEAAKAKNEYMKLLKRPVDPLAWRFVVADSLTIRKLSDAAGYEFRVNDGNFVHTTSSVLISPGGMISQYFYGTYFNYMHFDMAVDIASQEKTEPTRLKTLKYCYNYQPEKNRAVVVITTIFGVSVILVIAIFFLFVSDIRHRRPKISDDEQVQRKY